MGLWSAALPQGQSAGLKMEEAFMQQPWIPRWILQSIFQSIKENNLPTVFFNAREKFCLMRRAEEWEKAKYLPSTAEKVSKSWLKHILKDLEA